MKTFPHWVICRHCDSLYRYRPLTAGQQARCARCRSRLYRTEQVNTERMLALALTAVVVFVVANVCPVIGVSFHAVQNVATVWQAAIALGHGAMLPLAVCLVFLLIVAPLLQIVLFGWVVMFAHMGRCAPGFIGAIRLLKGLRPWSMVEVGMLGFLVAAIKLSGFLQVATGPGCWAMAVLMLLIVIIGSQDLQPLWRLMPIAPDAGAVDHE
ncbi:paraquat-inducible protein A [Serratia quinivorans]|uniref:paraquat-inducible protein A n=1 Tax=Serratia quinivorans TaxID=137545 RepID=UPI0021BD3B8C|nr:paraquat-inducible protein A [Serratia quinivorans]